MNLQNKVVIVTGAANGLGKALALECLSRGAHLALIDIDKDGLTHLGEFLSGSNNLVTIHPIDITNEESVKVEKERILKLHGKINILFNNAAISISHPFGSDSIAEFRRLFEVNFWGAIHCTKHFLPVLSNQNESRLVNIISSFAVMGFPGKSAYGSSKAALMGFTNSLKTELAGTNPKPSLVIPPPMATGIVKSGKHITEEKKAAEIRFLEKQGLPVEAVAKRVISQVLKGRYRIIVGRKMYWTDIACRFFPSLILSMIERNKSQFDFI